MNILLEGLDQLNYHQYTLYYSVVPLGHQFFTCFSIFYVHESVTHPAIFNGILVGEVAGISFLFLFSSLYCITPHRRLFLPSFYSTFSFLFIKELSIHVTTQVNRMSRSRRVLAIGGKH